MTDFYEKLSVQGNANLAAIKRARQQIEAEGRALPCTVTAVSGAVITVSFDLDTSPWTLQPITIPKAESPWMRMPTQVGDTGVAMPTGSYLGGISGLGGGTGKYGRRGNLSTLVFVPVSSANSAPDDENAAQVCGPNGAIIRTTSGTTSSIVTDTSGTTITFGSVSIVLTASGIVFNGNVTFNGNVGQQGAGGTEGTVTFTAPVTAPDVVLPNGSVNAHVHGGVESGSSETAVMSG
ncbi:hypothetical protein [Robbsia andropogonis]|uniref:hypothetical protein n=1 Tax=Robbsia andropogonis TaxID=28092 RepID=UPI002A6A476C|nr:hypothetical protein [Robbsia andropogonis]